MELGMIGLGRMGANMAERLVKDGHRVVGFDPEARAQVEAKGTESAASLATLVASLESPRTLWMMVPADSIIDGTVIALLPLLAAGDVLVDGGNSNYKDTLRRSNATADKKIS
jgi:6-phosphogluconate dehydrogenase